VNVFVAADADVVANAPNESTIAATIAAEALIFLFMYCLPVFSCMCPGTGRMKV
jgi:hypothetical protein